MQNCINIRAHFNGGMVQGEVDAYPYQLDFKLKSTHNTGEN